METNLPQTSLDLLELKLPINGEKNRMETSGFSNLKISEPDFLLTGRKIEWKLDIVQLQNL